MALALADVVLLCCCQRCQAVQCSLVVLSVAIFVTLPFAVVVPYLLPTLLVTLLLLVLLSLWLCSSYSTFFVVNISVLLAFILLATAMFFAPSSAATPTVAAVGLSLCR